MRFLHTSDWHLGRLFHRQHLTDDQAFVLGQFVALARDAKPDAILLAGDVYDRAVPPTDAVQLLDDTLSRLVLDLGIPVILVAGNHDSPNRLGFGARLLSPRGLHVVGAFDAEPSPLHLEDGHGPVRIVALPFLEPAQVREQTGNTEVHNQDAALRAALAPLRKARAKKRDRTILIAHLFVAGGSISESERPLSVGGVDTVGADALDGFDYVALGHLHAPQSVEAGRVEYSGSLLKYSFSEAAHVKGVNLVEMDARGACTVERIPLTPRRDVRCIQGHLKDLLAGADLDHGREDYLHVTLLDRGPLLEPMARLREAYPNVLEMVRVEPGIAGGVGRSLRADHRSLSDIEIFQAFLREVTDEEATPEESAAMAAILEEMRRDEREVAP